MPSEPVDLEKLAMACLTMGGSEAELRLAQGYLAAVADVCNGCDGDGLIYVTTGWDGNDREIEEPQACPVCEGTHRGTAARAIAERDSQRSAYLLVADATLPESTGPEQVVAEIRRLRRLANDYLGQRAIWVSEAESQRMRANAVEDRLEEVRKVMTELREVAEAAIEQRDALRAERDTARKERDEALAALNSKSEAAGETVDSLMAERDEAIAEVADLRRRLSSNPGRRDW